MRAPARADQLADHQALDVVHASRRGPSSSTIRSSGRRPAWRPGCRRRPRPPRRRWPGRSSRATRGGSGRGAAGDAEVGAAEAALGHQRADDRPRRLVDRHGEAEADTGDGGVDADDAAMPVRERAAGVARVERRVGLDHVVDDAADRGSAASGRGPRRRRPSPSRRSRADCRSRRRAGRPAAAPRRRARPASRSRAVGAQHARGRRADRSRRPRTRARGRRRTDARPPSVRSTHAPT